MVKKKNKDFSVIFVLGPPGSGKGTQIKLLAEKLGYYHFISSKIGKNYVNSHNDLETLRQMDRYKKGLLWDKEWMFKVVKEKTEEIISDKDECKGIIYDGSPRTLYEAEKLYEFLKDKIGKENIKIIEIDVDIEELLERIEKRLICSKSSEHVYIKSEKLLPGISCPEGDGILQERDLDKKEIFKVRIEEYKKETLPGLDYLKKQHDVIVINGDQTIEKVHKDIWLALKQKKK